MKKLLLLALTLTLQADQKMLINTTVANLRSAPTSKVTPKNACVDIYQHSQLLFGEHLIAHNESNGWLKVSSVEQLNYNKEQKKWGPYEGYLQSEYATPVSKFPAENIVVSSAWCPIFDEKGGHTINEVSVGTKLVGTWEESDGWTILLPNGDAGYVKKQYVSNLDANLSETEKRQLICKTAKIFVGQPYAWGGRVCYNPNMEGLTGVDCSSMVDLCYRLLGMYVPRDASKQYLASKKLSSGKDLKAGDLLFFERNGRIVHVLIYLSEDKLIHAFEHSNRVEQISGKSTFGKDIREINSGEAMELFVEYLGHPIYGNKPRVYTFRFGTLL